MTPIIAVKFLLSIVLFFYMPGHFLLKYLNVKIPALDRIVLSFVSGLVITVQCYQLAGSLRVEGVFLSLLAVFSFVYMAVTLTKGIRKSPKLCFTSNGLYLFLMLIFLAAISFITVMTSGKIHPDGMRFYDSNAFDAMTVLSKAQELARPFPHMTPFWSGTPFVGYHIDSLYWIALILRGSGMDAATFYFNFMPLILFPLALLSVYICAKKIFDSRIAVMATFFALFMGDLSWIFFITGRLFSIPNFATLSFNGNVLPSLIFTQPNIHAVIMFFCGVYFLKLAEEEKRVSLILASSIFFGLIIKYKSFYGIVIIAALVLTALVLIFSDRKNPILKIAAISAAISAPPALSMLISSSSGLFVFNPGYFGDLLICNLKDTLHLVPVDISCIKNTIPEIIAGSALFFLGSIGIKILSFPAIFRDIKGRAGLSSSRLFIIMTAATSFIFMNIVTLSTNYAYATSVLYVLFQITLGLYLGKYITGFFEKGRSIAKTAIILSLITLGVGSTVYSVGEYVPPRPRYKFINHDELAAIGYIKRNAPKEAVILHKRGELSWYWLKNLSFLWEGPEDRDCFISALTGRRVVAEYAWYMEALGRSTEVLARQKEVAELFKTKDSLRAADILKKYDVDYIWAGPDQYMHFDTDGVLREVFSKSGIKIYMVLKA